MPAPTGDVAGFGQAPRLAIGGVDGAIEDRALSVPRAPAGDHDEWVGRPVELPQTQVAGVPTDASSDGAYDGAPPTTGSSREPEAARAAPFVSYRVKRGDTLVGIAGAHGITMRSLWWANGLTSKRLKVGQRLVIPAVDGLALRAKAGDTVESIAAEYDLDVERIRSINRLGPSQPISAGDRLLLPGVNGGPIEVTDEAWSWPVPGGHLSQAFGGDHYALDIADDAGTPVVAARPGKVLFAGWRNNCGGYQVWIQQAEGLATTYNHLSSVAVGAGQRVEAGQRIGRVGATGCVTGPHVHFEVWRGAIWSGGRRIDPGSFY